MTELSTKTALIYDLSADYTHIAEAIASDFANVLYFSTQHTGFRVPTDYMPGIGLEGVENVDHFFDALERADLVIFPDVGQMDLQEWLRRQGVPVWGAGYGSKLELDRWLLHVLCGKAKIDVPDAELVHGIDALREALQDEEDLFVKVSMFRGLLETFKHLNWNISAPVIDKLSLDLGPYGKLMDFIVEQPVDGDPCVEAGWDAHCVDGNFPQTVLWGYEAKDAGYIGCVSELPEPLAEVRDKLSPILRAYRYRAPLTTEVRVCPQGNYLLDFTARFPCPPSELQTGMITNLAQIMWEGAHGTLVDPDYRYPYGAQLVLKSPWVQEHALGLEIGQRDRVAIHGHCIIEGQDYAVSPAELEEFGSAFGMGNSVADAIGDAIEAAESVKGHQVSFQAGAMKDIIDSIRTGRKLGLTWAQPRLKEVEHAEEDYRG